MTVRGMTVRLVTWHHYKPIKSGVTYNTSRQNLKQPVLGVTKTFWVPVRAGLDTHGDSKLAFLEDRYSRNAYSKRYFDSWDRPSRSNPLNH